MKKLLIPSLILATMFFMWTMTQFTDIITIPLSIISGLIPVLFYYLIDRYGFSEVNTIQGINHEITISGSIAVYLRHLRFYGILFLVGYCLGYFATIFGIIQVAKAGGGQ